MRLMQPCCEKDCAPDRARGRHWLMRRARVAGAVTLAAAAGACGVLENRTVLLDLRVLGIRASPPEVFIANFDDPGLVTSVDLSALVVDPNGNGRPVSARMTACPYFLDAVTAATGGTAVQCSSLPAEVRREFAVTDPSPRGIEHTMTATVSFDETTRQVFRAAGRNDRIYGMAVMTEWEFRAGDESVTALKRLRYTEPQPGWNQMSNQNPSLTSVRFFQEDVPGLTTEPEPILFERLGEVGVLPQLAANAVERNYVTPVATSSTDPTPIAKTIDRERVRLAFYATNGWFSPAVTSTDPGIIYEPGKRDTTPSTYTMPQPGQGRPADGLVPMWIVARDERGGTDWISRLIRLPPLQ